MHYDVVIIGGGHAGVEAAAAAARVGVHVALVTLDNNALARLSCNPAMGGTAKGQLIKEIDALGGLMAVATDRSAIQYRMLNRSKGPAVWSPRAQVDRESYTEAISDLMNKRFPQVDIVEDEAIYIEIVGGRFTGVVCENSSMVLKAGAAVLCNGTFLRGLVHVGARNWQAGRLEEKASNKLSGSLEKIGYPLRRFKTGTPPRVMKNTVDLDTLETQLSDEEQWFFSHETTRWQHEQRCCWRTYTNSKTHDLIKQRIEESPLFNGSIQSTGPRYCPSIEDKVMRFPHRNRHPLVFEPEGMDHPWLYLNGFSSSLPDDLQIKALRMLPGCENAEIARPGYAIEYDVVPAAELKRTLESRRIEGLYLAGQISGTSGYEEAGVLGLIAGTNAALKINGGEPFFLQRNDSYAGVLVDDLVTLDPDEPYRMFTSRAEYRLLLRQDNAEERLGEKAFRAGLISETRIEKIREKKSAKSSWISKLKEIKVKRSSILPNVSNPEKVETAAHLLKRGDVSISTLMDKLNGKFNGNLKKVDRNILLAAETEIIYEGYIERQQREIKRLRKQEEMLIHDNLDYEAIPGLSAEARYRLLRHRPETLGQASRLAGVNPSDLAIILIHIKKSGADMSSNNSLR